jgi:hypothetical protein
MQVGEQPLKVARCTAVSGGFLGSNKVVLECEESVDDIDFVALKGTSIAKAVMSSKSYYPNGARKHALSGPVVGLLKGIRDSHIDSLIKEHIKSEDPMAEADVEPDIARRTVAFHKAGVSPVITLKLPGFTLQDGKVVQPTSFRFLSSAKKSMCVSMECTEEALQWLHDACKHKWGTDEADEGDDRDHEVEQIVKSVVPRHSGVSYKINGDMVTLKAYSSPSECRRISLPRQASIRRSSYDDDTTFKMDLDMKARHVLKRVAYDDAENSRA